MTMKKINNCTIYFGDCRDNMLKLNDGSVQVAVTSPPYNIGKKYGKYNDKVKLKEWEDLIYETSIIIYHKLKDTGSFFLNLSQIPYEGEILPLHYLGYDILKKAGFQIRNIITWNFNGMQNCTKRLSGRYEVILWAVKDNKKAIFNIDDVRIPYITKNDKRLTGKGRNPTDVWFYPLVNNMVKNKHSFTHPTIYPVEMIERIVKMASNKGDLIIDPFLGSGTTLVAAERNDRIGIGFELDESYLDEITYRIKENV